MHFPVGQVDLAFSEYVEFSTRPKATVHLAGYLVPEQEAEEDPDFDEGDEEGIDEGEFGEDEESDEDEEVEPPTAEVVEEEGMGDAGAGRVKLVKEGPSLNTARNSTVVIEELGEEGNEQEGKQIPVYGDGEGKKGGDDDGKGKKRKKGGDAGKVGPSDKSHRKHE